MSGIVLAAGLSKRMGATKQDVRVGGRPMLERVVGVFMASRLDEVVVVLRPGLTLELAPVPRLRVVINPNFAEGISSSLRVGLKSVDPSCRAAVIGLGDKPAVMPSTIGRLVSAYEGSDSKVVIPTYGGTRGNPVLVDKGLFVRLLELRGDSGAKDVIRRNEGLVLELPVDDEGVLVDVDTPADLKRAEDLIAGRGD